MTSRRGDRGSPCLSPRELLKKPDGVPFTKTEITALCGCEHKELDEFFSLESRKNR
jgi:hypothetical protein